MIHLGRMRGARGWWPSNALRRTITVAGVDPVASGVVGVIDRTWSRAMDGRTGHVTAGEEFSPSWKATWSFAFDPAALRPGVTASAGRIGDPNIALPATSGERVGVAASGWSVMDSLSAIPPGVR